MDQEVIQQVTQSLQLNTREMEESLPGWRPYWDSRASENSWSIGEILEHIILIESAVIKLLATPSETYHDNLERIGLHKMRQYLVAARAMAKVNAPDPFHPKGHMLADDFQQVFFNSREKLIESLENGALVLDNRMYKHPFLGNMTVADWMYSLVAHAERHREQIREIITG